MARRNRRPSLESPTDSDQPIIARVMIRVSDVRGRDQQAHQGRDFLSPEMQLNAAKALCQVHGWTFDEETSWRLRDLDQSASRKSWRQRPGMAQHVADADAGRYNILIFYTLSRFARNVAEGLELWKIFDKANVGLYFTKESIDTSTATGRMIRTVLLAISEMQADQIAEYAEGAHALRAEKGKRPPRLPHWLKKDGQSVVIDEQAAEGMRRLVALRLEAKSYMSITRIMNEEGFVGPTGAPWTKQRVMTYLTGEDLERLAGTAIYHLAAGDKRIENAYPAIEAPEVIARVMALNARLRAEAPITEHDLGANLSYGSPRFRGMAIESRYLLSSLIRCTLCGSGFTSTIAGDNGRAYFCTKGREDPKAHPSGRGVSFYADPIEDAVARVVRLVLTSTQPAKPEAAPARKKAATREPEALSAEVRAETIRERMSQLVGLRLDKKIDVKVYDRHYAALEAELAEVLDGSKDQEVMALDAAAEIVKAQDAAASAEWRSVFLHLVERVEAPVTGASETCIGPTGKNKRYQAALPRRCCRVILRFPVHVDGVTRQTFIAPIYRADYQGEREILDEHGQKIGVNLQPTNESQHS